MMSSRPNSRVAMLDQRLDVRFAGHVHLDDRRAAAGFADLMRGRLEQRDPARAEHHRHPFAREVLRAGQSNSG